MMRLALFAFVCGFVSSLLADAADLNVPGEYATIQAAIDAAAPGDTIRVGPGKYSETLQLKDGVTLEGEDWDTTIVRCERTQGPVLRMNGVASGTATGLTFEHSAPAEKDRDPMFPFPVVEALESTFTLDTCRIQNGTGVGVLVIGGAPAIRNCRVEQNRSTGIYCWGEKTRPAISSCEVLSNGASGVSVYDHGLLATIHDSVIRGNKRYAVNIGHEVTVEGSHNDLSKNAVISYPEIALLTRDSDFEHLEAVVAHLRKEKSRFPSGEWQLGFFYDWIGNQCPMDTAKNERDSLAKIDAWKSAFPDSITWRLVLANLYKKRAWKSRGGGYAHEVSREGWQGYHKYIAKAWETVDDAAGVEPKDPEYYLMRTELTMEAPRDSRSTPTTLVGAIVQTLASIFADDRERTPFLKGTALEPLYYPLYYERTRDLLPRWHGSRPDMLAFAEESADKTRELAGESLYAIIVTKVSYWEDRDNLLAYGFSWDRIKQGYNDILATVPDPFYRRNHYCRLACLYEDAETAKEQFTALSGYWDSDVWSSKALYDNYQSWALGETSYPTQSPLEVALRDGNVREVRRLIDAGADPNTKSLNGDPMIMLAVNREEHGISEILLEAGADPNSVSSDGETALRYALYATDPAYLRLLLDHGLDPNQTNDNGWSLLMTAIDWDRPENAKELIVHGADLLTANDSGWTACHYATRAGWIEIVQIMIEKHPELINVRTRTGRTVLHQAVRSGHLDLVRLLVDAGADIHAVDAKTGKTPLKYAVDDQKDDIATYLREHGATE